jgi:hypothetical protein
MWNLYRLPPLEGPITPASTGSRGAHRPHLRLPPSRQPGQPSPRRGRRRHPVAVNDRHPRSARAVGPRRRRRHVHDLNWPSGPSTAKCCKRCAGGRCQRSRKPLRQHTPRRLPHLRDFGATERRQPRFGAPTGKHGWPGKPARGDEEPPGTCHTYRRIGAASGALDSKQSGRRSLFARAITGGSGYIERAAELPRS